MIIPSSITWPKLLEYMTTEGHLNPETANQISQELSSMVTEKPYPWYIQAIIGFAAWLAAIPFIGFLASLDLLDSAASMISFGLIFCLFAIGVRYLKRNSVFIGQLTLAFSLVGQMLLIGGIGEATDSVSLTALATIILELILLALYPDALHRFLSILFIPAAILVLIFDLEIQETIHILIIALAVGAVAIWESETYLLKKLPFNFYHPLGYGLVVSLLYTLIFSILNIFGEPVEIHYWWLSSLALLLILLALEYFIMTSDQLKTSGLTLVLIMGGTLIIFLPTLQAPGIVATVLILILAFHRANLLLLGLAAAFLAMFIILFYYSLTLTLLTKSLILMATGLALLALRFLLIKRFETSEV